MLNIVIILIVLSIVNGFLPNYTQLKYNKNVYNNKLNQNSILSQSITNKPSFGNSIIIQRQKPLRDLLGLGPTEIIVALVVGLVLFGPDTLKSLSKDVGRAAAELKEIPKTFKEGMDEGSKGTEVDKMKALAAAKRKKRDALLAEAKKDGDEDEEIEE